MNNRRSLKSFLATVLAILVVGASGVRAEDEAAAADRQAEIVKATAAFVDAFQKADAQTLATFWTPDGDYQDPSGRTVKGRKAMAEDYAQLFAESKGMTMRIDVVGVRFPTPNTAVTDGVTSTMYPGGALPFRTRFVNFLVKKDGRWLIESARESEYVPPNNYEHLRPIEWLIGDWAEDSKEPQVGRARFEWSDDQNFIVAVRAVGVKDLLLDNGSQRIGWDPAAKMIRSWNFEADGGFGHGAWKKDGDRWAIALSSVLRTGSLMTATTIVTRVDADTVTWQVKDQQLDGKPMPDSRLITMKRVK